MLCLKVRSTSLFWIVTEQNDCDPLTDVLCIFWPIFWSFWLCDPGEWIEEMMLRCPRGISLQSSGEKVKIADFKFPVMVKSLQASGSYSAHDMAVVWSTEDVDRFTYPLYVQEYINHDGTIFKIYVLGEHNFIVTRVSLPNFPLDYQEPVKFNSQDWKHELPPELTKEYTGKRKEPVMALIEQASSKVSQLLGLSLFGFDVIENVDTGKLAVIDVNYFPGTCGLSNGHAQPKLRSIC